MDMRTMPKKDWDLNQEAFGKFLIWLDPNPDQAGKKYEDIRRRLIKIFACRGCYCPEDLTDETINRVIRKIQDIAEHYAGDPALYFYGVAHNVHLEFVRKKPAVQQPLPGNVSARAEEEYECLEQCMGGLSESSRQLVLRYYQEEKHEKIEHRKRMSEELDIPLNALRIRACRIRMNLQSCVLQCLEKKAPK